MRNYVKKWDWDGVTIWTDIAIKNGTDLPIKVDGFEGDIFYMGSNIAKVGLISKIDINSKSSGKITVGAKILYGPATTVIIEAIKQGKPEPGIKLVGKVFAGPVKIPVSTNYNLW